MIFHKIRVLGWPRLIRQLVENGSVEDQENESATVTKLRGIVENTKISEDDDLPAVSDKSKIQERRGKAKYTSR